MTSHKAFSLLPCSMPISKHTLPVQRYVNTGRLVFCLHKSILFQAFALALVCSIRCLLGSVGYPIPYMGWLSSFPGLQITIQARILLFNQWIHVFRKSILFFEAVREWLSKNYHYSRPFAKNLLLPCYQSAW
jgi:hypothetical protein